jgi:hypothetical protein
MTSAEQVREVSIWWAPIPGSPQEQFWDDDTPDANLLFTGGWFAGKTMTLTGKVLKLSAINHPIQGFWLVPDWGHVDRTILPMLSERDPDTGNYWFLSPDQWHYNQRTHVLTWDGGGPIQFLTAENPSAIAGPSGAFLAVDEPGSIKHEAWRNAVARVRASGATLKQKVASGTWEGLNWLADLFGDPERPEAYKVYSMATAENIEGLRHNPTYIAQVKDNITEAEAASYLDAKLSNLTGSLAFPNFDEGLHWTPNVPALDPDAAAAADVRLQREPDDARARADRVGPYGPELHVPTGSRNTAGRRWSPAAWRCASGIQTAGRRSSSTATPPGKRRHVKSLKSNYQIIKETLAAPTAAGVPWARKLEEKVPTANPSVSESTNAVNRLLKDANGHTRLWIRKTEPRRQCPTREIVRSLQRTSKKSGTDDIEKKAGETHTHAGEALRYLVAVEFPS